MNNRFVFVLLVIHFSMRTLFAQPSPHVESGKVVVQFKSEAFSEGLETKLKSIKKATSDGAILSVGVRSIDDINRRFGATNMRRIFPDAGDYEAKHRKYGLHLWYEIDIPESENPETVASVYSMDENVQISEPRYKIRRHEMPHVTDETPNDPYFNRQWNLNNTGQTGGTPGADIRLLDAWEKAKSIGIKNSNVIVAIVDGGVNYNHEDIRANIWVNQTELNGETGVDDDNNGYIDDIYGYNFVDNTCVIAPEYHATHVAGIVGAVTGNGIGIAGIAGNHDDGYGIKIMTTQILNDNRYVSSIAPAFIYAADNGAVISQNSWGYNKPNVYQFSDIMAINYFINEAGKDEDGNPRPNTPMVGGIVFFAAGNDAKDDKWYPAYFNNVVAVAATNHYGKLAHYSNYGNWIDISAPGGDINEPVNRTGGIYSISYRSNNNNYYEYLQGTSMACPHVSAVAALILSVYGNDKYTPDMLRSRLLCSATPIAGFDPQNAHNMGAGLVNASSAIFSDEHSFERITDLRSETVNAVSCLLKWTAPDVDTLSDDDLLYYTIAWNTQTITDENFYANNFLSVAVPKKERNNAQFAIKGLNPQTKYYLAIRNTDYQCQTSDISNVVNTTTSENLPPLFSRILSDTTLIPRGESIELDLTKFAFDPEDEKLTFSVKTTDDKLVNAYIVDNILNIAPKQGYGETIVQITATDPHGAQAIADFNVTVEQKYPPGKNDKLLVYPNPAKNILWLSFNTDDRLSSVYFRIIDSAGRIILQTAEEKLVKGIHYHNLNTHDWLPGIYFVQYIKNGKTIVVKKIVKE